MASRHPSILPSPLKLRDSCFSCAKSKLRCGREKPACTRCMRVVKRCDYIPCRRPGRARASPSENGERDDANHFIPTAKSIPSSSMTMPSTTLLPGVPEIPTIPGSYLYQDVFLESSWLTGETPTSSPLSFDTFLFDISGVSADSSMFNARGTAKHRELETTPAYQFVGLDHGYSMTPTLMPSLLQGPMLDPQMIISPAQSLVDSTMDTQSEVSVIAAESPLDPQCSCLMRAFGLLHQLSLKSSKGTMLTSPLGQPERRTSGYSEAIYHGTRAKKEYLQDVISMVKCACSEDPHLLSIKSLLAFKLMGLYDVTSSGSEKMASANHCHLRQQMKFSSREGHSFLSHDEKIHIEDLHLVRQLVGFLSSRLRGLVAREPRQEHDSSNIDTNTSFASTAKMSGDIEDGDNLAMPTGLLRQLEIDLRQGLRRIFVGLGEMER
ncbi:hypothetical protein F5Y08DRAFT_18591 [Xylaria arbuscula]|nr:hypothetical protein F5Y08DRAFT_18591 [Xylaria arbuscula]